MAISLQKGQKISLTKENEGLSQLLIGLGWDEKKTPRSGGFLKGLLSGGGESVDCDASAVLCKGGKFTHKDDVTYFGNLKHKTGAVQHMGDNLTGAGEGDDEQLVVDLQAIPADMDKLYFVVNIYQCVQRKQHFGLIQNAFIRIVDRKNGAEICRYNLTDDYNGKTAVIFGEVYRNGSEWKFNAIGEGTTDTGLNDLLGRFK